MCVNYQPPKKPDLERVFGVSAGEHDEWPDEVWQDYPAPIIRAGVNGERITSVATFGMVPKRHVPEGVKPWSSMNARAETIGSKRTFAPYWRKCSFALIPMNAFYEPNWESGKAVRWRIGMVDKAPFGVAGLWRSWNETDGSEALSFSLLTINANAHPLLKRFHKPAPPGEAEDKRSLVIVPPNEWDAWLQCHDPEMARSFLRLYPAERMTAEAAPKPLRQKKSIQDQKGLI
jgi:putative SOS response-associated peptidase YedK